MKNVALIFLSDSESSQAAFSSFDSDCDPQFLPSSNEELSSSNESQKRCQKRKRQKISQQFEENNNQFCCSKSLPVNDPMSELESAYISEGNLPINSERSEDVDQQQLDEFLDVDLTDIPPVTENILEESDEDLRIQQNHTWKKPAGNHQVFDYNAEGGIHANYAAAVINELSPITCFRTFLNDSIIDKMVEETNLYATQVLLDTEDIKAESRLHKWVPTDKGEMLKFIGIVAYMGMVKMPSLDKYWSTDELFHIGTIPKIMSRNRFQLLLRMRHFSNNATCPDGDRLHKVKPLLEELIQNFQAVFTPGRTFCIDESIVPFQGRLLIKQYIPQKTHKYGVKSFKLCSDNGYTWNIRIYGGKERNEGTGSVPTNIVIKLSERLLDSGRTIIADNYYTSLELSNYLLDHKTHYVGTLRANRRGNPKQVTQKKLKKGKIYGLENERGICILKWRDKRDVLVLSTKHTTETVDVQRRDGIVKKPRAVIEYNEGKSSIDQSDQMSSYQSPLRKSLKWYRNPAIEFILGTSMVNAHIVYNQLADKKFRRNLRI